MGRVALLACLLLPLGAEVVDRIAIVAGRDVITELQVDEELRVTAFLNNQALTFDAAARRAAANHLIEQLLVEREMKLSRYPLPETADIDKYAAQVRDALSTYKDFDGALRSYGLTPGILRQHLQLQLTAMRFIELRFRPDLGISASDIEAYYQRQISQWKADHPEAQPPTLADLKDSIRKTLAEQRTDQVLDAWLEESRKQANIVYLDQSLQ
jgi:hypothetical protein